MKGNIERRLLTMMAILGLVFFIAITINIFQLRAIRGNNNTNDIYTDMANSEKNIAVSFQQVQLYSNLTYFKRDSEEEETIQEKLLTAIDEVGSNLAMLESLCVENGDQQITEAFHAWQDTMTDFCEFAQAIYADAETGNEESVKKMVDEIKSQKEPVQEAEDAFESLLRENRNNLREKSGTRIQRNSVFNYVMLVIYLFLLVATCMVLKSAVIRPMRNAMSKLKNESDGMMDSANKVSEDINESNKNAGMVSNTMESMSSTIEEISATLTQMASDSDSVMSEVDHMAKSVSDGVDIVIDIKKRADEMHESMQKNKESASSIIKEIRTTLETAVDDSRSVTRINELTNDILSITSQTNLLSLNASIEAARAGKAGRGFSVVAEEIRSLADNSRETANTIQTISSQVIGSVERLIDSAEKMLNFINNDVSKDYDSFLDVAEQYKKDADSVNEILMEFSQSSDGVSQTVHSMSTGINDIAIAVGESANEITGVAENAISLVNVIDHIQKETKNNQDISIRLREEVDKFDNL